MTSNSSNENASPFHIRCDMFGLISMTYDNEYTILLDLANVLFVANKVRINDDTYVAN